VSSPGRNDPCPCGSNRRYKQCCGALELAEPASPTTAQVSDLTALLQQGDAAQAETQAERLLARFPEDGALWKVLGTARRRAGKDARAALQRATELIPDDAEVHAQLGSAHYEHGQWSEALASLTRAVNLAPTSAAALVDLANTLLALKRGREALQLYERALEREPRSAEARNNMGNALLELRRFEEAADWYRLALQLQPNNGSIHANLASALIQQGRHADAIPSAQQAIALAPDLAAGHNLLGLALAASNRRPEAVTALREALKLKPDFREALGNLADLLQQAGAGREALEFARRATALDPQSAPAHLSLAKIQFDLQMLDAAEVSFRRVLELDPSNVRAALGMAAVLRVKGDHARAMALGRAVLDADPKSVEALALLGELAADRGQFTEAHELFGRALVLDPDYSSLYSRIAAHRRMTTGDGEWLAGVERLLQRQLPLAHEIDLRFALGKYFDDLGRYDEAFENYRLGNELTQRDGRRYAPARLSWRVERLRHRFDAASLARLQAYGSDSERPLFIVGMPRSGTSLTEQILAAHPQAFGAGEVRFWDRAFNLLDAQYATGAEGVVAAQLAQDYLARITRGAGEAVRVTDKMPANFLYAGLIHALFPRARIIHLMRHPLDTCLSIYFQNFFSAATFGRSLENLAHYYGEYLRIMAHWRGVLPPTALLEVPYEALVQDQEGWTRRMLEFAGLPWDPCTLDFHETERVVITASRWQVRQRISTTSVGRWRHYAKHLEALRPLLAAQGIEESGL
jgi:tetratricopeptide (TPR) repeat protein